MNSRKTWNNINKILGKTNEKNCIETLLIGGQIIDDSATISENMNSFFAEIGHIYANTLDSFPDDNVNMSRTLVYSNLNLFLTPVSIQEMTDLVLGLDSNKGPGIDGITAEILKNCVHNLSPILVHILNNVFTSGKYPDELKIAKITPIFKDGDRLQPANYRPISVLPTLNKVFERAIQTRFVEFLGNRDFFYSRQYGFRAGSGTHTAVFELINEISLDLDSGNVVSGLFLDLSKAFDCVDHSILITKLEYAGIRGTCLELVRSYLSGRMQSVKIGEHLSDSVEISIGVPQGSILGPLFFLVYINDMGRLPLHGNLYLYADDSALFYTDSHIRNDEIILSKYFRLNRLCLNASKSRLVNFHSMRRSLPEIESVIISGHTVELVKSIKYLGLLLDENLTWRNHVVHLCKRLSSKVGILGRLRFFLPVCIMRRLYFALIHSSISYLVGIWGAACTTILRPLQILQNRAIRFACKLPRDYPTRSLYSFDGQMILNICSLYRFSVSKFVHQSVTNNAYHTINFRPQGDIHTHNTRNRNRLRRPLVRRNYGLMAIAFSGPTIYESVPLNIRSSVSFTSFVIQLKRWLHSTQSA